jgi:hypothetical protein
MLKRIRVLLADDHGLFRAGIRSRLQTLDCIEIVAGRVTAARPATCWVDSRSSDHQAQDCYFTFAHPSLLPATSQDIFLPVPGFSPLACRPVT